MEIQRILSIVLLLIFGATAATGADLTLVANGEVKSLIVLADKPSAAARVGAVMMAAQIERISGAKPPILPERYLTNVKLVDGEIQATVRDLTPEVFILIGESGLTKMLGVQTEGLGAGGILLRTFPNALVLLGTDDETPSDPNGTRYAVTTFLEEVLGFRFLWPGELGLVAPPRKTVKVPALDKEFTPIIGQRYIRSAHYDERLRIGLEFLGLSKEDSDKVEEVIRGGGAELLTWFGWQRLGGNIGLVSGHAYNYTWEKYHIEHPDWFALQSNGSRDLTDLSPNRTRLCKSNIDLIDAIAADKIAELDKGGKKSVSLAPSDGGYATFCMCPECKKLDPAEGRAIKLRDYASQERGYILFDYVSLTDRMVWFWNQLATRITKKHPDARLTVYAYSVYHAPPIREKLHPNLAVGFVHMNYRSDAARKQALEDWDAWAKMTKMLYWRPNLLLFARSEGTPAIYAHKLSEDLNYFAHHSLIGTDFDTCTHNWATEGLNYYVLARLLWNPDASVDAILDDYCQSGFGEGWRDMRRYLTRIEELTDGIAKDESSITAPYTPAVVAELGGMLDAAAEAAGGDETARRRVEFLRRGLEFTALQNRAFDYHDRHMVEALGAEENEKLLELQQEKWLLMRRIFREEPLALNAPMVAYGGEAHFRKLGWFGVKTVPQAVIDADEEGLPVNDKP